MINTMEDLLSQHSKPQLHHNKSKIFIAVSKSSDPTAGWWFTEINSAITIGTLSYVDYPGLAVSSTGIYITANMFSFSTGHTQVEDYG